LGPPRDSPGAPHLLRRVVGVWSTKPCFLGRSCWCRIIVDPDGEECNDYGDINLRNARLIVDALNRIPGAEKNVSETHPLPWHTQKLDDGREIIVTTTGLSSVHLKHVVAVNGLKKGRARLFVDAVNSFYACDENVKS